MCARLELGGEIIPPGRMLKYWIASEQTETGIWSGFARVGLINWWKNQSWEQVDIPADKFAERSSLSGQLTWSKVPKGKVIRGLKRSNGKYTEVKIVTREADDSEMEKFNHDRMPVIEIPLYNSRHVKLKKNQVRQLDLFN